MKSVNIAKIFILLAIIAQLMVMSGWIRQTNDEALLLLSLGALLCSLFFLRKQKRKNKNKPRQKPKEVDKLLSKAGQDQAN